MIECELKVMLSAEEYKSMLNFKMKDIKTSIHINYYYDTIDFKMTECGTTYRIRKKHDSYVATVKKHLYGENFKSDEKVIYLGKTFDDKCFTSLGLTLFGSLITERSVIISNDKLEVVLDKNTYLDRIDYEMEIECREVHEETAKSMLREIGIMLHQYCTETDIYEFCERINFSKNKSQRFFERLQFLTNAKYNTVTNRPD